MLPVQIIFILFFILAIIGTIFRFRQNQINKTKLLFWLLFWLAAGVVVVMPDSTAYLADMVGIGRGADLVIYASLAVLFFLNFNFYIKLERANREITKLTRALALKDEDKK